MILWTFLIFSLIFVALMLVLNLKKKSGKTRIAFFHPFCNDGGGGQKVLWSMIQSLIEETESQIAIYSLEQSRSALLNKVKSRFGINLHRNAQSINVIFVEGSWLLTSKPYCTMAMHLILPLIYCVKCLWQYQPDVFYDTTGYPSTSLLVKMLLPKCKTMAYVHYPFISADMIKKVAQKKAAYNNSAHIAQSAIITYFKLIYYKMLLFIYRLYGYFVNFAHANSSWTFAHMQQLWGKSDALVKLYPPCTIQQQLLLKKKSINNQIYVMSLAQFRPEKQQMLQITIIKDLNEIFRDKKIILRICGTTRNADDQNILHQLQKKVKDLKMDECIKFEVNKSISQLINILQESHIGLHTMEAEHFGISVVEMMAAGLIVFAHDSAGPKEDIVKRKEFLAQSKDQYVDKIKTIIQMNEKERQTIIQINREQMQQFGFSQFKQNFILQFKKAIL